MLASLIENGPMITKVAEVLKLIKKLIPTSVVETQDAQLRNELERIALSAPHMLADIGFKRDPRACSNERVVWRRGVHCVIIFCPKHASAIV